MSQERAGVNRVGVVGTGTIGASWAAFFLSRGLEVSASDPAPKAEGFLRRFIETTWPSLLQLGLADGATPDRLRFSADPIEAVEGVDFVQENGPEREDLKIDLFERLGAVLPREIIIASSSSALLVTRLQSQCRFPERCVLGHPFNPPHLVPLVEVVGGARSSPAAIARAMEFYGAIGKHPIHIRKEIPGHVANRLQSALWREAVSLLAEGVASVADIDTAIAYGPGLRWSIMGPYLTFHLAGGAGGLKYFLDHIGGANLWGDLGHPVMNPALEQAMIDGGAAEAAGRSIAELESDRDVRLIALMQALAAAKTPR